MEDEIDLAQYVKTVFKHWKLVLGITLAAVIVAGVVSFVTPPVYEAMVLIQPTGDAANAQRMALIAKSPRMAQFVLRELADNTTPAEYNLESISGLFEVKTGDIYISCTARHTDAQKAAELANAWSDAFSKYAIEVSLNSLTADSDLQARIKSTYTVLQETQTYYESFQRTSQIEKISKQIADARLLYQALQLQESQKNNEGSSVSGDAVSKAFLLLKIQSYTSLPQGTQLLSGAVAPVSKADIDNLVGELEDRSGIHGKTGDQVFNEINALSNRLEMESQRSAELLNTRDAALNDYLAAMKNAQSVNIQRNSMVSPVRLVDSATPPEDPMPSNRLMNMGIALVLGLIVGVIAAFVAEYFEKKKAPPADAVIASVVKQSVDSKTS